MRWPWHKPETELSEVGFERWLRAGRPPFDWFARQPEDAQEVLAQIGDHYVADLVVGFAAARVDPVAAAEGLDAPSDPDAEAALARRVALGLVERIRARDGPRNGPRTAPVVPAPSMGGLGERRGERQEQSEKPREERRSFLGRPADEEVPW